jgi:hypothetical protein
VDLRYNVLADEIRTREGGISSETGNLEEVTEAQFAAWFADPESGDFALLDGSAILDLGLPLSSVADDFCGNLRDDGAPDLGIVEHDDDGPCDTTLAGGGFGTLFGDGFESGDTSAWRAIALP